MTSKFSIFFVIIFGIIFFQCHQSEGELPIIGPYQRVDGQKQYYPVPDFELYDQYGDTINAATFKNSLRIVDFFFISCPSICPKIQRQMKRINDAFPDKNQLQFISHSIDTKRDTVDRLARYATSMKVKKEDNWHFVTGTKDQIFSLADDYFNILVEDESAPGGYDHSGRIVLVDKEGYIRAFANGLKPKEVNQLILSIDQLLENYEKPAD